MQQVAKKAKTSPSLWPVATVPLWTQVTIDAMVARKVVIFNIIAPPPLTPLRLQKAKAAAGKEAKVEKGNMAVAKDDNAPPLEKALLQKVGRARATTELLAVQSDQGAKEVGLMIAMLRRSNTITVFSIYRKVPLLPPPLRSLLLKQQ